MSQPTPQEMVRLFHERFGFPVGETPRLSGELGKARFALLDEESDELRQAVRAVLVHVDGGDGGDPACHRLVELALLAEVARELADFLYILYGFGVSCGLDLDEALREVHRANMTKTPGAGPKPLKGLGYVPPSIASLLMAQEREREQSPEI